MLADGFHTMLLDVAEGLSERFIKALVGADVLHAKCFWYSWQAFELDDGTVFAHLLHLFAILYVDVRGGVLHVVLDGEAVTWWWTLAS